MFRPRVIPVLLLHKGGLYKTVRFADPTYLGDPINAVKIFNDARADELVFLDIDKKDIPDYELISKISEETQMPFSYGGSIDTLEKAVKAYEHGAEKVVINSACYQSYDLITQITNIYGGQALIVSIDVRKNEDGVYILYSDCGKKKEQISLETHIQKCESAGAGEFFINSIDRDGTYEGYDLELFQKAGSLTQLPVIACGGGKDLDDLERVVHEGTASAAAAGSLFVFMGIHRAVMINYPEPSELISLFNKDSEKSKQTGQSATLNQNKAIRDSDKKHKVCNRCIMDTTDPHILFDKDGVCNHCTDWFKRNALFEKNHEALHQQFLEQLETIKKNGEGKPYDCVIGVSGGTDSTYLAYQVKKVYGLRPIAVHLDNGWNSKLSVTNIKNTIQKLDIPLYTHVIDWEEFKHMQRAYLKSHVLDVEALSDHAIIAILYKVAEEHGVNYILTGHNPNTEQIMPKAWTFYKNDLTNLKDIIAKNEPTPIVTFPTLGVYKLFYYEKIKKIKIVTPFVYQPFRQEDAHRLIAEELQWQDYGGKHNESIITKFYQSYILPKKYSIDKRKAHLSSLICMGEITREDALDKIKSSQYTTTNIEEEIQYFAKKLDFSLDELKEIIEHKPVSHFHYKTNLYSWFLKKFMVPTNPVARWIKKIIGFKIRL